MENHGQMTKKKKKKKRFPQLKNFDEFHQQSLFFYKIYQITTSYWLENSRGEDEFEGGGHGALSEHN